MTLLPKPEILTDRSRLQEIFHLRVTAYVNSPKGIFVDLGMFPEGMFDELDFDKKTTHVIIQDRGEIIAAARFSVIASLEDVDEPLSPDEIPSDRPFGYLSRLVVHQDYRNLGLSSQLVRSRSEFLANQNLVNFILVWATQGGHQSLTEIGYKPFSSYTFNLEGNSMNLIGYILILNK